MVRPKLILLVALLAASRADASPWLTFTEVSSFPAAGGVEFVEIYNIDAPAVDLSGWRLEGAVSFEFPRGTSIAPRECLVVAKDLAAFRTIYPKVSAVVGPFTGELPDRGGRIRLRSREGTEAAAMRFGTLGAWSSVPRGTGYTAVLGDVLFDPEAARSWKPSAQRGGSPGSFEQVFRRLEGKSILRRGERWRFFRGTTAPPQDWFEPEFDDSSWDEGPSGFGFGDGDDATELSDMRGNYLSVFTRKRFTVDDPAGWARLRLLVDYDDGFVAFLNGREVARANLGAPRSAFAWNLPARGSREAGQPQVYALGNGARWLRKGENVICVAGFNNDLSSSDLSLAVELDHLPVPKREARSETGLQLSEVALRASDSGDALLWIEFFNAGTEPESIGGRFLSDDASRPKKWRIPAGEMIPPRSYWVVDAKALGAERIAERAVFLADGDRRILDAMALARSAPGSGEGAELSFGRGSTLARGVRRLARSTRGAPNAFEAAGDIVIHEIHYHPPTGDADAFVEIHNRGTKTASLAGLRLDGLGFRFAPDHRIPAGGFVVVVRDPPSFSKRNSLSPAQVLGPFTGSLSRRGESVRLVDSAGRTLDAVEYADREPWPRFADGGGSSLELVDARIDNALPGAWAASDERATARWQEIEYEAGVHLFRDMRASSFQFLLLDAGECLIDDLRITDANGKVVLSESFDGDAGSLARWRAFGTHLDSKPISDSKYSESACLRIFATGRGNSRHNYVSCDLDPELEEDARYTVAFRAKWLAGSALLLTRTSGQGLARRHQLLRPNAGGTPGRPNSRATLAAPIVGRPEQAPIAPSSEEPTRFVFPISARTALATAELRYRSATSAWSSSPLTREASGEWTATIPPLPRGRVEFYAIAIDRDGRRGQFPPEGAARPAQYAVDLEVAPELPTYTVLVSEREWNAARARQRLSNRTMDATLVYGDQRIFYNVGFRARGSGFTRGSRNWRVVLGRDTLDGRSELTFDGQGRDRAMMNERLTFWLLDQVGAPTPRQRYVRLNVVGHPEESGTYEDVEKINGAYVDRWFAHEEGNESPRLHKIDDYWDFRPPSRTAPAFGGDPRGFRGFRGRGGSYVEAYLQYETDDPEDYRWNFPPRANGGREDFRPLLDLIRLVDPRETSDDEFRRRVESLVDVDEWIHVLAARTVANDWDTYGLSRGKNAYLYRAPSGRWKLLPWDSDLSWFSRGFGRFSQGNSLFYDKFPAVRRLLAQPPYRREFLSTIAFLARKRLEPARFRRVLDELEAQVGSRAYGLAETAAQRREQALRQIPSVEFRIEAVSRGDRSDEGDGDRLHLAGTAPLIAHRLVVAGRAVDWRFRDLESWTSEIDWSDLGPEYAADEPPELRIEVVDRDGDAVGAVSVAAPKRPDAK